MKKYVLFASAILAFAACTSDDYVGDQDRSVVTGERAISFGFDVPTPTRASGAEAATALGNQFIVWGEKSEATSGEAYTADDSGTNTHQLVFQNYVVNYTASSAYTTTSNTKDWEYVGLTQSYGNNVTPKADETQTIKYWDYSATNYVFTAFSAQQSDLSSGNVTVTKITAKTDGNKVYDKGYTVTLAAAADPTKLYFSDRQVVTTKNNTVDRNATNQYGGNVTFTFRNGVAQVRAAMYETVPGYQVEIDKFYYADAAAPAFDAMTTAGTDKFYANVPNLTTDKAATLTVTYYETGERVNQPKIAVSGTLNNYLSLGTNLKDGTTLGETIANAVYDKSDKSFTMVFPQESNATNLKLKVDYTLKNAKTGETIQVTGATAEVPAAYLQWKGNFKYTYIFKISDNTNGSTGTPGTDPAGLYPITFDAAVIEAENGEAEYITTVSEPSITTFGVDSNNKYVTGGSEYAAGSDIYATIVDGSSVIEPTLGTNVNIYKTISTSDANFPVTEASLAEAIAEESAKTKKISYALDNNIGTKVTSVPAEDGTTINQNAVKLTGLAAGTYAVEYIKTARTYGYVEVTYPTQEAYNAAFAALKLYTVNDGTDTEAAAGSWTDATTKFYKKVVTNPGVYTYKVIVVQ